MKLRMINISLFTKPLKRMIANTGQKPRLRGLRIRGSITGKHVFYVNTDVVCNKED